MDLGPPVPVAARQQAVGPVRMAQQGTHRLHHLRVVDDQSATHAALGGIVELHGLASELDVFAEQRRDAERVVLLGVLITAGAEVPEVEQVERQREDPVALPTPTPQIRGDLAPHLGEGRRHLQHPVELLLVALLLPLLVVEVLTTASGVGADGLDVSVGIRADPHLLPGGWDHQSVDPVDGLLVGDGLTVVIVIREAFAAAHPAQPRTADYAAPESHRHPPVIAVTGLAPAVAGVWKAHHGEHEAGARQNAVIDAVTATSVRASRTPSFRRRCHSASRPGVTR